MYRVLLLCKNNAILSPIAEGYFRSFMTIDAEVYHAGVTKQKIEPFVGKLMLEDGIDISSCLPHSISEYKHLSFDYILTFDSESEAESHHFPSHSVKYHFDFEKIIPDDDTDFDKMEVYRAIRERMKKLIKAFIKDHFTKAKAS